MAKKTTIYDIAEKLNLTAATVSRALNGSTKISIKTRKLISDTAAEMNYTQNRFAQALKSGKSYNVAVIVPKIDIDFFGAAIRGIEETLNPHGYHVIISQTYDKGDLEVKNINSLLDIQIDCIFMSVSNSDIDNTEIFKGLVKKNIPFIFFDRKKDIKGISSVVVDDYKGAYDATKHLIEQGCKRIAHLTNNHLLQIFKNRYLGYRQALLDYGLDYDESLVIETPYKVLEGRKTTKKLLEMNNPPDAIFAIHDYLALGAIQEIKAHNLKVPEDICVVGFSNEPFSSFMELPITSVNQSPLEMGKIAANIFLEELENNKNVKSEKHVVLTPELIIRKSSLRNQKY
ncbi:LacI family DNA-binding transcriptional regulator [Mariniflexile sp. HNIBRBA6329]|uniref:LacI family DNA-binding transcriptional regulator n=1 Tax=Mariniflexile sp. HNIBRBA6329 TaxID=3373088 RepID=UPI003744D48E